ncbi:hypothetical protein FCV25MIE_22156 [Fagus crenata]
MTKRSQRSLLSILALRLRSTTFSETFLPLVSRSLQDHKEEPLIILLLARNCREIELPSDRDLPTLVFPAAYGEVNRELVWRDSDLPPHDRSP